MYLRQLGYAILPGHEERAVALCEQFVSTLYQYGVPARVVVATRGGFTLQISEEYRSLEELESKRRFLDRHEGYQSALSAWAREFYPLVQAAAPAIVIHHQQVA